MKLSADKGSPSAIGICFVRGCENESHYVVDKNELEEFHQQDNKGWREIWRHRTMLTRFDTRVQAEKWVKKKDHLYDNELKIDIHPKDGYVVYQAITKTPSFEKS
ncbi:hypothetical protein ACK8P5_25950 (plasmid) [Paenibacillus sp. EC2-1]|uniref:hypothetical protein n=1 Tax=Paenibacillus sp. EC2-1 TaxID=3388665 RepID=UPI003BEF25C5